MMLACCPKCNLRHEIDDNLFGQEIKCEKCQNIFKATLYIAQSVFFKCSNCGFERKVNDSYLGKKVKCPKCKAVTEVSDKNKNEDNIEGEQNQIIVSAEKRELRALNEVNETNLNNTSDELNTSSRTEPAEKSTDGDIETNEGILDIVESLFLKMIEGIFWFIFVKLPKYILNFIRVSFPALYNFFKFLLPKIFKISKIGVLFCIWTGIVIFPSIVTRIISVSLFEEYLKPVPYVKQYIIFIDEYIKSISFIAQHLKLYQVLSYFWIISTLIGSVWGVLYLRKKRKKVKLQKDNHTYII